jgi:RNA polymerase sigma factor (sigma-70 family)
MNDTDLQLLERFGRERAEDAFAEIVRRHLGLVFSAALRQVRSPHLAEEVAQSVFTDLARQAHRLAPGSILSAWLYQVTRRTAIDVVRREARRQAREQAAYALAAMNATDFSCQSPTEGDPDWDQIAPMLDEAMHSLGEPDRAAVLLRFFENKSLLEVGQVLGTSEEAARKRVSRAVERLRAFLSKRGVAVGASGLAVLLSAHAVEAVPAGLAATITTSATVAGATLVATGTATLTKAIIMTVLQKSLIVATLATAVGAGIYEACQVSRLRDETQALQRRQAPLAAQVDQLQRERDEATNRLAAAQEALDRANPDKKAGEVLKLRGEVGTLRQRLASTEAKAKAPSTGLGKLMSDPSMKEYIRQAALDKLRSMFTPLFDELNLTPDQRERFLQLQADKSTNFFAQVLAVSQGNPDQIKATQAASAEASDEINNQLRGLLGDAGYARYDAFGDEIPAQTTLSLLDSQLSGNPLSQDQRARLLQAINAEPNELTRGIGGSPDLAFTGSQADVDSFLQRVTDSNQHIAQQASAFLSPDQLTALNTVLANGIKTRQLQGAALMQPH